MENNTTPLSPTPAGRRGFKISRKMILIISAAIVLLLCGWGLFAFLNRSQSSEGTNIVFMDEVPYEFTKPLLNLDPGHIFTFPVSFDPTTVEQKDAISVYSDSSLKHEVATQEVYIDGQLQLGAPAGLNGVNLANQRTVSLSKFQEWGLFKEYFIVQRRDFESGKALAKPLVTKFTVRASALQTPDISYEIDNRGAVQFRWNKVDKAEAYYIVKLEYTQSEQGRSNVAAEIIGDTKDTKWDSFEQDKYLQQDLQDASRAVSKQNAAFQNFTRSEDELRTTEAGSVAEGNKKKITEYGVIAYRQDDTSPFSGIDGATIESRLPVMVATNARAAQGIADDFTIGTFDAIPTALPITMADGTTALRAVMISAEGVTTEQAISSQGGAAVRSTVLKVPYAIQGTAISGFYRISQYNEGTYQNEIARIAARNASAQAKTGNSSTYDYVSTKKDLNTIKRSQEKPKAPYKVNATNSFSEYLAANMIAGNEYIDVSKFITGPVDLWDAYREAFAQNPYILAVKSYYFYEDKNLLEVQYFGSKAEREQEQKAIAAEVQRVTDTIIRPDMSDADKVTAINDYLIGHADYNYEALSAVKQAGNKIPDDFARSWTPAGVLIDKKGVCASYAYAFKALADAAGLRAVYVTGMANSELHAWNKVQIDGKWRMIDVTWNDAPQLNRYFLLTDQQASGDHYQDNDFVIDALVGRFATQE